MNLLTLPSLLAQATNDISTDMPSVVNQQPQVDPMVLIVAVLVSLGMMFVFFALMFWKVFTKAGYAGWTSLIPIYNFYVLCKIGGKPGWWLLLLFIPLVGVIFGILLCIAIAERFGQGAGFGVGLAFLGIIFFPILGFGSARYQGAPPLPAGM